ncbi:hypothetical protein BKG93_00280 [Rodentibacter ratti]|uniref:Uncharacterized protein n=2 Tax=Rodentibacter ratti TaxID=1906745 RepID=A0A1V3LCM0_9PAST|nr:hypothetical protein BKG93_00280 [Rodentibacter ratti]
MELGKTTEQEVKEMYSLEQDGINSYSDGNQYYINTREIDFDGLKSTLVIFDKQGILVGVLSTLSESDPMKHGTFSHLYKILNNKYKLVKKERPFVGDQFAKFKDGNTEITLNAPHMGNFEIRLDYIRNNLLENYKKRNAKDKKAKIENDASAL